MFWRTGEANWEIAPELLADTYEQLGYGDGLQQGEFGRLERGRSVSGPARGYRPGMRARGRLLAGLYVGAVSALAASAFWSPNETFTWNREGVAMLLTLPALLPALPAIYILGACIWNVTDAADGGGPMWPVTLLYTLMFAGVAAADVWLLLVALRARRRRRLRKRGEAGADLPT